MPRVQSPREPSVWILERAAGNAAFYDKHQFNTAGSVLASISCVMAVRLTRKLSDMIDGIDLSACRVGDVLHLPWRGAWLLIAEGWAEMIERRHRPRATAVKPPSRTS
jgi:hypothetical protein